MSIIALSVPQQVVISVLLYIDPAAQVPKEVAIRQGFRSARFTRLVFLFISSILSPDRGTAAVQRGIRIKRTRRRAHER